MAIEQVKSGNIAVEMRGITKKFGSFTANNNIDMAVRKGEVHAILGENGAGKSTLMNMLYGMTRPTSGRIFINGEEVEVTNPNVAISHGIGMVHQHFMLVKNFSVMENIILGREPSLALGILDTHQARKKVVALSELYGLQINPDDKAHSITVGMQQRVEIIKTLYRDAQILILDEPTAVLTPLEVRELGEILKSLTDEGKTVILITHKLHEVKLMANRCTIIRRGKKVDTVDVADYTENQLAAMMVGREITFKVNKLSHPPGQTVLKITDLCVKNDKGLPAVSNVSLSLRKGEILGIAGIDGNGQSELVEAITGLRKIESGRVEVGGQDITGAPPKRVFAAKVGHIPADRQLRGLVMDFSVAENIALECIEQAPFSSPMGLIKHGTLSAYAAKLIWLFDIRPANPWAKVKQLSGGNQQKVIIAREIAGEPDVLIAAQPTRGLDVGAVEYVHKALVKQRDEGKAVLLVSLELDEIINISDRIAVLYEGMIVSEMDAQGVDEITLGLMMGGV